METSFTVLTTMKHVRQLPDFVFHFEITFLQYPSIGRNHCATLFGFVFPIGINRVLPSTDEFVVVMNGLNKSLCCPIRPDDLVSKSVITNRTDLRQQRIVDCERFFRNRNVGEKGLSVSELIKLGTKCLISSICNANQLRADRSQQGRNLLSTFDILSPLLHLSLLPRYPNCDQDSPYRADCLEPARPITAIKFAEVADGDSENRKRERGDKYESRRASKMSNFGCHYGILT